MLVGPSSIKVNDQIILKQLRKKDAQDLYLASKQNQEELKKWLSWGANISLENTKKFIEESLEKYKKNRSCDLGIFYNEKLVGTTSLRHSNLKTKSVELAYWLSKTHCGKGIITKSCRTIIDYAFNKLDFERITIEFFPDNKKSCAVAKRLGFELEAFSTKARIINDKRSFYICYSLMKSDYQNNFWNNLEKILKKSKIIIDYKKGSLFNGYKDIICPVDFGYLKSDWEDDEQLDIFIGSDKETKEIDTVLCSMDMINKVSDIKILYQCTKKEKKKLFKIFNKLQGSILVEK